MPNEETLSLNLPALTDGIPPPVLSPPSPIFPRRPKQSLKIDKELVVRSVKTRAEDLGGDQDRGKWLEDRLQRYSKYRGWLPDKTTPWENAANTHPPILQISELRINAGLHNVIMTMRPLMSAKATKRGDIPKEDRITQLLDTQFFLDPGPEMAERRFGDFVSNFLQDGNAVAYTPWVRDERDIVSTLYRPAPPEGIDAYQYVETHLSGSQDVRGIFPGGQLLPDGEKPNKYRVAYLGKDQKRKTARCEVFSDEDGSLELVIRSTEVIFDGPVMVNVPISSLLIPTRCENLQPPSEWNPNGAPYVFMVVNYRIDDIKRLQKSGVFNSLSKEDLQTIIDKAKSEAGTPGSGALGDRIEEQKDEIEGREATQTTPEGQKDEDVGHLSVPFWLCFDRWDVDGDGLAEDVFWQIAIPTETLCESRLLTDRWPSVRPYRPLAEAIALPVPGRWYGISFLELGEALYDLIKGTLDMAYDSAATSNLPFFFYTANAAFRAETVRLAPGEGYPVPGDPRTTVYFPQMQGRDQGWAFSVISLAMQMHQQLTAVGDLQLGRVATGKASALRTFGTTLAILQQGDVRADQLLLRLFGGLRQIARNFHAMNRHLLPPGKEVQILGWEGLREEGYVTLDRLSDIDAEVQFDFRPDFLLSNPAVQNQALQSVLAIVGTPLAFQLGVTDPKLFYTIVKDFIRSLRLDPKKYSKPPAEPEGPPYLAEEVIDTILSGQIPQGIPAEGADAHLKKLHQYMISDQFGLMSTDQAMILKSWLLKLAQIKQQEQAVQAAQQFQAQLMQQSGSGGMQTTMQEPPQSVQSAPPVSAQTELEPANA